MKISKKTIGFMAFIFVLSVSEADTGQRYWVFFNDKPGAGRLAKSQEGLTAAALQELSARAVSRRKKVLDEASLIDSRDFPVSEKYTAVLESLGAEIIVRSRWLNAVSIRVSSGLLPDVVKQSFIRSIRPVGRFVQDPHEERIDPGLSKSSRSQSLHSLEYGYSLTQLNQIRIPDVHDLGLSGEGVLIGLIDSGFDTQGHRVFSQTQIVDTYDFYWDDKNTANEPEDTATQHNHGTLVLSIAGGFHDGVLIGAAYGASFALAKTEWIPTETRLEEDLWVAGLEWLESIGADIVSSSLGYGYFDDGFSYTYQDLNGDVCVTSIAADIAVQKGVLVLTSAGNEALNPWHYILSPADGDSVIAVGAVDWNGVRAPFSSGGPTSDGRIKPDVMAPGMGVYGARPDPVDGIRYISSSGTSVACPLAAGVCALILQARPELTPMDIREALRQTANHSEIPDNEYGWGLIDAYRAVFYYGPFLSDFRTSFHVADHRLALSFRINSVGHPDESSIQFKVRKTADGRFFDQSVLKMESNRFRIDLESSGSMEQIGFYISLTDSTGTEIVIPKGAPEILYHFGGESPGRIAMDLQFPGAFTLFQNAPNPFNTETRIKFLLTRTENTEISITNIKGQLIRTLLRETLTAGEYVVDWDGCDSAQNPAASGIYILLLKTPEFSESRKMILSR